MARLSNEDVESVPGAFWEPDLSLFRVLLEASAREPGDLAEIGVLLGRSAVLIGDHRRPDEAFTVVDLFETPATVSENAQENADYYAGLTRAAFEENYLSHHDELPTVVQGLSDTIVDHASHGTHRFVHVDASHLYEHVAGDIAAARTLMTDDGVLVLDDFRAEHTPGVAAAAWQAVVTLGLRPFAVSPFKLYATWQDPDRYCAAVLDWALSVGHGHETQLVNDVRLVRVFAPRKPRLHPVKPFVPPVLWPALAAANRARALVRGRLGRD